MDTALQARLGTRYRIERSLGQGGMGTVYLALDTRLNRHVAIKSLSTAAASEPGALERFRVEVDATARLRHPHIVQIMDMGLEAPPFMVLEVLSGESLRARLIKEPVLSPARACMIMTQVLSALAAAHEAHIVHRDIKPANIFLVDTPPPGVFAKVLDFGVARLLVSQRMTQAGQSVGSIPYMSPEQHRGLEVTGSSDLFTCGLVLYEMLSGRRPFLGRTIEEGVYMMLSGNAPAPIPSCPPELNALVLRAIALEPARRFSTAQEMGTLLASFVPRLTNLGSPAQMGGDPSFATTVTSRQSAHTSSPTRSAVAAPTAGAPTAAAPFPPNHVQVQAHQGLSAPKRSRLAAVLATSAVVLSLGGVLAWYLSRSKERVAIVQTIPSVPRTSSAVVESSDLPPLVTGDPRVSGRVSPGGAVAPASVVAKATLLDGGMSLADASTATRDGGKTARTHPFLGASCTSDDVGFRGAHMYCKNGVGACFDRYTDCGGSDPCQSLDTSAKHCGACGKACASGQYCDSGRCFDCSVDGARRKVCNGECVWLRDNGSCGNCGVTCAFPEVCMVKPGSIQFGCGNPFDRR